MTRKPEQPEPGEKLLIPAEVGRLFRVNPKTVTRWVLLGKIGATKTLGGHHRFHEAEVRKLLELNYIGGDLQARLAMLDRMIAAKDPHTFTASG